MSTLDLKVLEKLDKADQEKVTYFRDEIVKGDSESR